MGKPKTAGLLHRGAYTALDRKFSAKLNALGFSPAEILCAISFYGKYAAETKNGKFPKAIPFSPENVIVDRVSRSTFYRTMKFGEGKTWRLDKKGGGRLKNHYEAITDWLDMELPAKSRKRTPIQNEYTPVSKMNIPPPIQDEQGQESVMALEVMPCNGLREADLQPDMGDQEMVTISTPKLPAKVDPSDQEPLTPYERFWKGYPSPIPDTPTAQSETRSTPPPEAEGWNDKLRRRREAAQVEVKPDANHMQDNFDDYLNKFGT